jgi:hypothetical protein
MILNYNTIYEKIDFIFSKLFLREFFGEKPEYYRKRISTGINSDSILSFSAQIIFIGSTIKISINTQKTVRIRFCEKYLKK